MNKEFLLNQSVLKDDNLWMSQEAMAELFNCSIETISQHLKKLFTEGELNENATAYEYLDKQPEGAGKEKIPVRLYSLDAVISVGYRVNTPIAKHFRIQMTKAMKEFMVKGFTLNDERFKNEKTSFEKEQLHFLSETLQSIRTNNRRVWQQLTDVFIECSSDYNKSSDITKDFFNLVENKFYFAITGQEPKTKEACLNEKQVLQLEQEVAGFYDYIEELIYKGKTFTMEELAMSIDAFLSFRDYRISDENKKASLTAGKTTSEISSIISDGLTSGTYVEYDPTCPGQTYVEYQQEILDKVFEELNKENT